MSTPLNYSLVIIYSGPPPAKKSRSLSDDSVFSSDVDLSLSRRSSQTDSTCTSMAGPSSTTNTVAMIGLDTKLGTVH
jgi:hypothetical protein